MTWKFESFRTSFLACVIILVSSYLIADTHRLDSNDSSKVTTKNKLDSATMQRIPVPLYLYSPNLFKLSLLGERIHASIFTLFLFRISDNIYNY